MDLNLNTLKQEILEYLESREFAVFRSAPGVLEGNALVLWDVEKYPDYQMFLEAAVKAGVKLILFAAREFAPDDLDGLLEQLEECELVNGPRTGTHQQLPGDQLVAVAIVGESQDVFPGPDPTSLRHGHTVRSARGAMQGRNDRTRQ